MQPPPLVLRLNEGSAPKRGVCSMIRILLTFGVVTVDVKDGSVDHLANIRAVEGRPCIGSGCGVTDATKRCQCSFAFACSETNNTCYCEGDAASVAVRRDDTGYTYLTTTWMLPPTV